MTNNYIETLEEWSRLKGEIHTADQTIYKQFSEREIVWCSIGLNVGYEISGKGESFNRPVLVYKKLSKELFIGLPFTRTEKKRVGWYFYNDQQGYIVFEQMRTFSTKRIQSRYKRIPKGDFEKIKQELRIYLNL